MSEHITNMEVEDVLSSIRRLVKTDDKIELATEHAVNVAQHDKLLLTPALRVDVADTESNRPFPMDTFVLRDAVVPGDPEAKAQPEAESGAAASTGEAAESTQAETPVKPQTPASVLSAKIAALETAIGNISGQWEPDTPGADDYSGTKAPAIIWQDDVDLDAKGKPIRSQAKATPEKMQELPFVPTGPSRSDPDDFVDDILDEEALRVLVADIVRSELQGELGARITRNVRKLVRREIHRALAARDLG